MNRAVNSTVVGETLEVPVLPVSILKVGAGPFVTPTRKTRGDAKL
jgi:hypothetical protein